MIIRSQYIYLEIRNRSAELTKRTRASTSTLKHNSSGVNFNTQKIDFKEGTIFLKLSKEMSKYGI